MGDESKEISQQIVVQEQRITPDKKKEQYLRDKEQALSVLESHNYLTRDDEGRIIVDLNKFKASTEFARYRSRMGPLAMKSEYGGGRWIPTLFHTFKDLPVYSPEDYDKLLKGEDIKPISLFYSPQNAETALSIDEVKNSDFYMGLWEIGEVPQLPNEYPTLEKGNNSGLSTHEAVATCIIYHPKYGNGKRGKDGELYVNFNKNYVDKSNEFTHKDKRAYRMPVSGRFFASWGYKGSPVDKGVSNRGDALAYSPANFFIKLCPNMVKMGLISVETDFNIANKTEQLGPDIRIVHKNGLVRVSGKTYSLGREFGGNQVYQFSKKYAGILDADFNLKQVFKLNSEQYPDEELARSPAARKIISKSEISFLDPVQVESLTEEDGILLSGFKDLVSFSRTAVREGGFNVLDLTAKEQALATSLYRHYKDNTEFHNFIQKYGLNGIRSMMAVEEARNNAELIWEIGNYTDATKLFTDVSGIVQYVTAYTESIKDKLSEEERKDADEVAHTIMSFTSRLLLSMEPIMHNDLAVKGKVDLADVISSIRSFKNKVRTMYASQYGLRIEDKDYRGLLEFYRNNEADPNLEVLALNLLHDSWMQQISSEDRESAQKALHAVDNFYSGYSELFETASETTGDTREELDRFKQYLMRRELSGNSVDGVILDIGCGDGKRITKPMADMMEGRGHVIGVDRVIPDNNMPHADNLSFVQGDFTQIPLPDNSVNLATAHWSVINDLTARSLQLGSFNELARVLKIGGEFYFDVPDLEEEGKWNTVAQEYHDARPDTNYGMIKGEFPGGRTKEFYLYPESEIRAFLKSAGFVIETKNKWRTENNMPRYTMVARLERKVTGF